MKDTNKNFLSTLKEIVSCCHDLHGELDGDKARFAENNLLQLNESNAKKEQLLNHVHDLITHLNFNMSISFLDNIEQHAAKLEVKEKYVALNMGEELKEIIGKCYQALTTNSAIVYSGMQDMKNLWDNLLENKQKADLLYNQKGSISK